MSAIKFSEAYLRNLKPRPGQRYEVTDALTTGLKARVSPDGTITFVLKARGANSKVTTITLGKHPDLSLKEARTRATENRLAIKNGEDVNATKRSLRQAVEANGLTLRELLEEYREKASRTKKIWQPAGPKTERTQASRVIEAVFASLLDQPVESISAKTFATAINNYQPAREGKETANGQASRARAYLGPVLDWAAGRKAFNKVGASRPVVLDVASMDEIHDPASSDPEIKGERSRVLTQDELERVLPLLKYPAPVIGKMKTPPDEDYRPIAFRFILYTAARLNEVASMRWQDLDRLNGVWRKPVVKATRGPSRGQSLPLSGAALDILRSLPGWSDAKPTDLVFPNSTGGKLGNLTRFQKALCEATGTRDWHRHDLRRTASTLMYSLKISAFVVDQILAHTDPLKREGVSASAHVYIKLMKMMTNQRDPQEEALSILAEALEMIEQRKVT